MREVKERGGWKRMFVSAFGVNMAPIGPALAEDHLSNNKGRL